VIGISKHEGTWIGFLGFVYKYYSIYLDYTLGFVIKLDDSWFLMTIVKPTVGNTK